MPPLKKKQPEKTAPKKAARGKTKAVKPSSTGLSKSAPKQPNMKDVKKQAVTHEKSKKNIKSALPKVAGKTTRSKIPRTSTVKRRQAEFLKAYFECNFSINKAAVKSGVGARTVYHWRETDPQFSELFDEAPETMLDIAHEYAIKNIKAGDTKLIIHFLNRLGNRHGLDSRSHRVDAKESVILKELLEDKVAPMEAAIRIHALGRAIPEFLKLQLSKNEPPAPPDDRPPLTSEELEQKYQESLAAAEGQRENFLPGRQEEVRLLKEEMKNLEQFGPDGAEVGGEA